MILKLLLLAGVAYLVYHLFFKKKSLSKKNHESNGKNHASDMVACAKCETYCEIDDTILSQGNYFCSQKCANEALL